jgi:putative oxidoreductase
MTIQIDQTAFFGLLLPCGVLLIFAAYTKLKDDIRIFEGSIEKYKIVPKVLLPIAARLVVATEIVIFLLCLAPPFSLISAIAIFALGSMFFIVQLNVIMRGLDISCGCFGDGETKIGLKTIVIPVFMTLASGVVLCSHYFVDGIEINVMSYLGSGVFATLIFGIVLQTWNASFKLSERVS